MFTFGVAAGSSKAADESVAGLWSSSSGTAPMMGALCSALPVRGSARDSRMTSRWGEESGTPHGFTGPE